MATKNQTQSMSRSRFLQEYRLEVEKAFLTNGRDADWAPSNGPAGPRFWGEEDKCLELAHDDPNKSNVPSAAMAASPDNAYLAVATNSVIRIYEMETKQQRTELVGHIGNVGTLYFVAGHASTSAAVDVSQVRKKYVLLSEGSKVGGADGEIIMWDLNSNGKCSSSTTMPFAVKALTDKAMGAIADDLTVHHELAAKGLETIHAGLADMLKTADARNRAHKLPHVDGHFPTFGSTVVSHDGQRVIYVIHGVSTQSGMRPPDELPQIVIFDIVSRSERFRLKGHTDAIMWAAWSPDDKTIAIASWDQTFSLWDAETGACTNIIGPTDGQNWAGTFSPDGQHALLSGGSPTKVAIYDVQTGKEVTRLNADGRSGWMRTVSWNVQTNAIALYFDETQSAQLWCPYSEQPDEGLEILKLKDDGSMLDQFCSFTLIKWVDDGKKLVVRTNEDSLLVWEPERHVQWRFQRPFGTALETYVAGDVLFRSETQTLLSLDGDGKVREWKL
ncbi:hypothetical protein LTR36_009732 [Oleoguttula mirabilis]|uniref:Mitochondrial division protein 1 n=1 Tax=Oleoguttula mirabilis TaxID=1507867 RepID=A0AAV9J588_9PEZI|nr:hypothetical protein LTR36_009732 [Oleoguttula mirabilis]